MSDLPETIWAILRDNSYPEEGGEWLDESASFRDEYNPTQYTRTDIIPTWNTDMEAAPDDKTPLLVRRDGKPLPIIAKKTANGDWINVFPTKEAHRFLDGDDKPDRWMHLP